MEKCDEVHYGHWIDKGVLENYPKPDVNVYHLLWCSECGWMYANYCPGCGTHMNNEGNEENYTSPIHRTLDEWNNSGCEKPEKNLEISDAGFDGIIDNIVDSDKEE